MTEHIQMPDVAPLVRYVADGTQTIFSYPFPIFSDTDLAVYIDGAKQASGYTVSGAGETGGGQITFDDAPANNALITLSRELSIERLTDYLEGGEFSASSINTELDYIIASLQQVSRNQSSMLRYDTHEVPANIALPEKSLRQNKALGFDGSGNPIAVSLEGAMATPDFTAQGAGASLRTSTDKLSDIVSVRDFGAVGDGVADDTNAFINALIASNCVFVPEGEYRTTTTIPLGEGQSLFGAGQSSVIKCQSTFFHAIDVRAGHSYLANLKILLGRDAVRLIGIDGPCVHNRVENITADGCRIGVEITGDATADEPAHYNVIRNVKINAPTTHGVYITKGGATDAPMGNSFRDIRVFSDGATTAYTGMYIQHAEEYTFIDNCYLDMNGATVDHCIRLSGASDKTILSNITTKSSEGTPNIRLDSGSTNTVIMNLNAMSDGPVIDDDTNGEYQTFNAGAETKYKLGASTISDLKSTLQRYDIETISSAGTHSLDLSHSVHLIDASVGDVTAVLPAADTADNAVIFIKKTDSSDNIVSITESGGDGADEKTIQLGGQFDYARMISDGAVWHVLASNRMSAAVRYANVTGTYDIDMAADVYIISSYSGAVTARLPLASASESVGRTITIKKSDGSANAVTVTEQSGAGPDQASQALSSQYKAITVVSDGGQWFVVSKY